MKLYDLKISTFKETGFLILGNPVSLVVLKDCVTRLKDNQNMETIKEINKKAKLEKEQLAQVNVECMQGVR